MAKAITRKDGTPRTVYRMPFLLAATMGAHCVVVAWAAVFVVFLPLGWYELTVPDPAADVRQLVLELYLALFVSGCVSAAVVYGLRMERPWAREVILLSCALAAAFLFFSNAWSGQVGYGLEQAAGPLLGLAFYAWYLYGKRSVRSYYRALSAGRPVHVEPPMIDAGHSD